jgi:hypothetical protein
MNNTLTIVVVAIIVIAIAVTCYLHFRPQQYQFFPLVTTGPQGDLGPQRLDLAYDIPALQKVCDDNPKCAGFISNGWFKKYIDESSFYKYFKNPTDGLYAKLPIQGKP